MEAEKGSKSTNLRKPVPTYQHYVNHFEELYRQSPLAKVIVTDVRPKLLQSSECRATGVSPSMAGPFKVPTPVLAPKNAPTAPNVFMSPVAQLIQQMQGGSKQGSSLQERQEDKENGKKAISRRTPRVPEADPLETEGYDAQEAARDDLQERVRGQEYEEVFAADKDDDNVRGGDDDDDDYDDGEDGENKAVEIETVENAEFENETLNNTELEADAGKDQNMQNESRNDSYDDPFEPESIIEKRQTRSASHSKKVTITEDKEESDREAFDRSEKHESWSDTPKTSKLKKKETVLDQWIVKWLGTGHRHIAVEGHRPEDPEDSFWHSTAIAARVSNCLLQTSSGSHYRIRGKINKLLTLEQGFSENFVHSFKKGFPRNWEVLVALEHSRIELGTTVLETFDAEPIKKKKKSAERSSRNAGSKPKGAQNENLRRSTRKTGKRQTVSDTDTSSTPALNSNKKRPAKKTPTSRRKQGQQVTPNCIHVNTLKTTQSGRKVMPPLQYWTGQRQRYIPFLNGATELLEGSVDYTPVSATNVRLTGSIDISEREKRIFSRFESSTLKKSRKKGRKASARRSLRSDCSESELERSERDTDVERTNDDKTKKATLKTNNRGNDGSKSRSRTFSAKSSSKECQSTCSVNLSKDSIETVMHKGQKNAQVNLTDCRKDCDITTENGSADNKKRPSGSKRDSGGVYDLFGAVMGVVEGHRKSRLSSRRRSRESRGASTPAASTKDQSFELSDDEDFSDVSLNVSSSRRENSGQASRGVLSRSRRKSSNRTLERSLLGSNMDPSQNTDEEWTQQDNHEQSGKGKTKRAEDTGQTEARKSDRVRTSRKEKPEEKESKSEDTFDEHEETPKKRSSRRKKPALQKNRKGSAEDEESWQPDELQRLQRAMKMIPPSSQQFWLRVAAIVGTRSEWECQEMHQGRLEGTARAPRKTRSEAQGTAKQTAGEQEKAEPVALTAGKGTMRRKRQLKEFIQQHNQNTEEDLFDSTPFKKQKTTAKTLQNLDFLETLEEEDDDLDEVCLKTPSTRFLPAPLSSKKTPHSWGVSPGLLQSVERKHMDQYIHGFQKKRGGGRRGRPTSEPAYKARSKGVLKSSALGASPAVHLTSEMFQVDPVHKPDSDEDEADYYWSDEDQ